MIRHEDGYGRMDMIGSTPSGPVQLAHPRECGLRVAGADAGHRIFHLRQVGLFAEPPAAALRITSALKLFKAHTRSNRPVGAIVGVRRTVVLKPIASEEAKKKQDRTAVRFICPSEQYLDKKLAQLARRRN